MVDLDSAEGAREGTVIGKTHEVQARTWRRFREWCDSVGLIDNYYLENFSRGQRIYLIRAFPMAMCGFWFSGPAYETLTKGTIRGAVSFVASSFRENDRPNPTKDEDGELGQLLSRQYRAFRNKDPNPV